MEALQESYLRAVVAAAGCSVASLNIDDGIDAMIKHRHQNHLHSVDQFLQVQLKATMQWADTDQTVSIQMSASRFALFAEPNPTVKKIVVIMRQPAEPTSWINVTDESLLIRHCSYWVNLAGQSSLAASPTISASRHAIFDEVALCSIMQRIGQGGSP
jgi:hypothetical protein